MILFLLLFQSYYIDYDDNFIIIFDYCTIFLLIIFLSLLLKKIYLIH